MILDNLQTLLGSVNAQMQRLPLLITAVGSTVSTNTIDLNPSLGSANGGDSGYGNLDAQISIDQTLTSAGAATVAFQLIQADDANLSVNVQVLNQTDAFPYTMLVAGTRIPLKYQRAAPMTPKRYAGMRVVVAGAALTNALPQFWAALGANTQDTARIFNSGYRVA